MNVYNELYLKGINRHSTVSGEDSDIRVFLFGKDPFLTVFNKIKSVENQKNKNNLLGMNNQNLLLEEELGLQIPIDDTDRGAVIREENLRSIYVGNLEYKVSEEELKEFFSSIGKVKKVRIPTNLTGQHKGFGYVEFEDKLSVEKAFELNRKKLNGREVVIRNKRTNLPRFNRQTSRTYYSYNRGRGRGWGRGRGRGRGQNYEGNRNYDYQSNRGRGRGRGGGGRGLGGRGGGRGRGRGRGGNKYNFPDPQKVNEN
ncbi:eukaryotic initiation factor 4b-related [Anaeramoeba flamelloides]|uniref:Eukaryotic initiation factor 4b-related n=1 Tax=Anaeramoeba flamelloides TaxID=1746091 RepID=A0AAV7Z2T8_9EUKA|nr:eukaryotic initiation factor 4b-related [Anaeramoeba flamelloides]